ncbi:MAG: hypothetical protein BWY93_02292 [Euryarchaeota archaeon ADurb.BinA087]|nr:MAG: hypothetical protein BWY93_02292 [Euryarchaeota archaeon ADurb.BinA087]
MKFIWKEAWKLETEQNHFKGTPMITLRLNITHETAGGSLAGEGVLRAMRARYAFSAFGERGNKTFFHREPMVLKI